MKQARRLVVGFLIGMLVTGVRLLSMGFLWLRLKDFFRALFVAFTFRDNDGDRLIRVISARYTHKKERSFYEELKKSI